MPKRASVHRGQRLEFLVSAVFQGQGYLVRRGIPLRHGVGGEDATDIDVMGVRFTPPFQHHLIICDCKERQRPRAYERVFWAKGVSSFVDASETYVAVPRASLDAIHFARSGQVRLLTQDILQDSYDNLYQEDQKPYGIADQTFFAPLQSRLRSALKDQSEAANILDEVKSFYLERDPYVPLNVTIDRLGIAASKMEALRESAPELFRLWRYLSAELTVVVSLLLLRIASDTIGLSKSARADYISTRLTYGNLPPRKAQEVFETAKILATEVVKSLVPSATQQSFLPFDIGSLEPPSYAHTVVGLVDRITASPSIYNDLPHVVDFLLFGQALQDRGFLEDEYRHAFPGQLQEERLKVARNIFSFVRDVASLDMSVFWPKEDGHLPR